MSKKSSMSLDNTPFRRYFGGLLYKLEAMPNITGFNRSLILQGEIDLPEIKATILVEIALSLSDGNSCWVLRDFRVITDHRVLSGNDFLEHYGKRPGREDHDLSDPGKDLWTMTCAANLQALLEAYDKLAKELGLPAIFGH